MPVANRACMMETLEQLTNVGSRLSWRALALVRTFLGVTPFTSLPGVHPASSELATSHIVYG